MKRIIFFSLLLLSVMWGQTTLSPGDVAFIAVNSDEPGFGVRDDFSFLLLANIESGTEIRFTCAGWNDDGYFTPAVVDKDYLVWTSTSAMNAGETVHIYEDADTINLMGTNKGSVSYIKVDSAAYWALSGAGDQVFAFQGAFDSTASFIAGIHWNRYIGYTTDENWDGRNDGNTYSELPDALSPGESSVWIWDSTKTLDTERERDNMIYDCSDTTNTKANLLASINNKYNWTTSRATIYDQEPFPATFTVTDVLPVELIAFEATHLKGKTILSWETATEKNNYGFEIERASTSSATEKYYEKIGFVEGYGNSNSVKEYSFMDNTPVIGKVVYRLKQIDFDGKYEYSKEIEITTHPVTEYSLEQNYPNPFNPSTKISFALSNKRDVSLKVFNSIGEEVAELVNKTMEAGKHSVIFNAVELPSGVYFCRMKVEGFTKTTKLLLMK